MNVSREIFIEVILVPLQVGLSSSLQHILAMERYFPMLENPLIVDLDNFKRWYFIKKV